MAGSPSVTGDMTYFFHQDTLFNITATRPISSHLDRTSLVNKGFITWHKEDWKNDLRRLNMQKWWRVLVFSFSSSIPTEKSQKIFLLLRKIFCERKLSRNMKRTIPSGQHLSIVSARVANHSAGFGSLTELCLLCIRTARLLYASWNSQSGGV